MLARRRRTIPGTSEGTEILVALRCSENPRPPDQGLGRPGVVTSAPAFHPARAGPVHEDFSVNADRPCVRVPESVLCVAELQLRAGVNRLVRTRRVPSADGSLTMIAGERPFDGLCPTRR
jgi:hypothetical protein